MKRQECLSSAGKRVCFISNDGRLEFIGKVDYVTNEPTNYGVVIKNPTCYFLNKKGVHVDKGITLEKEYRWSFYTNIEGNQQFPENSWFKENDLVTRNSRLKDVKDAKIMDYEPMQSYDPDLYSYVKKHINLDSFNNLEVRDIEHIDTTIDEEKPNEGRRGKTAIDDNGKTTISEKIDRRGLTTIDSPDNGATGINDEEEGRTVIADDTSVEDRTEVAENNSNREGATTI